MDLPSVFVKNSYSAYLNGQEVEGTARVSDSKSIHTGERVLVFKDSVAATFNIAVPREKQSEAIGVEGMVTEVLSYSAKNDHNGIQLLKVLKV